MVTKGNLILASDINTIITKINAEENTRGVGLADLSTVTKGDLIYGQTFKDMITRNAAISASHCYCQGGGVAVHQGCPAYSYSPTASSGDYDKGDLIIASTINEIDADINTLVAECDCNTNCAETTCSCQAQCPAYCNPNWKILECACYWQCSCNTVCTCNRDCNCEYT